MSCPVCDFGWLFRRVRKFCRIGDYRCIDCGRTWVDTGNGPDLNKRLS